MNIMNIMTPSNIYFIVISFLVIDSIYQIYKVMGCDTKTLECDDKESYFVRGTKYNKDDTLNDMVKKLKKITSYNENMGMWRIALVMASLIFLVVYMFLNKNIQHCNGLTLVSIHLVIWTLLWFYFNFIDFHHFKHLKENGEELILNLLKYCKLRDEVNLNFI